MAPAVGIIAGISALAGGAAQVVGEVSRGNSEADAANYNANVANQNAGLARQQASEDERVFRIQSRQQLGDIRSGYAASGVNSEEGSASDVLQESASSAELDALKIRHGGEVKANQYEQDAYVATRRGQSAQTGGYLSAAGTLLGTAAKGLDYFGGGSGGRKR